METTRIKIDSEVMNGFKLLYVEQELKEAGLSLEDFMSNILNRLLVGFDQGTNNVLEDYFWSI